ncbi:MAG: cytochrome c3 family protein [Calditrichia bacterium]
MNTKIGILGLTVYFLSFVVFVLLVGIYWSQYHKTPEQPINFSHKIHVSKVQLECTHCHTTVEKSEFAGIPSVQTCMTCHESVKTESPEIQKLTKYWKEKRPVPWKRIYRLPVRNYVYFSHKRHIKADLECSNCHGNVEVMPVIKRQREMEMGWCVSCHEAKKAPLDCATCHK